MKNFRQQLLDTFSYTVNFFFFLNVSYLSEKLNKDSKLMKKKNENSGTAVLIAVKKNKKNKSPDDVKIKVWLSTLRENRKTCCLK